MIIYDLICDKAHRFEGWFQSAEDFESQASNQLLQCPQCQSPHIRRIPSAVAIGSQRPREQTPSNYSAPSPTNRQAALKELVNLIKSHSEDVGSEFANEARRIHYHEAPERSIRGQASKDDYEALLDEGIEVMPVPQLDTEKLN